MKGVRCLWNVTMAIVAIVIHNMSSCMALSGSDRNENE